MVSICTAAVYSNVRPDFCFLKPTHTHSKLGHPLRYVVAPNSPNGTLLYEYTSTLFQPEENCYPIRPKKQTILLFLQQGIFAAHTLMVVLVLFIIYVRNRPVFIQLKWHHNATTVTGCKWLLDRKHKNHDIGQLVS